MALLKEHHTNGAVPPAVPIDWHGLLVYLILIIFDPVPKRLGHSMVGVAQW